jgi:phosphate transport system substrate-binding protein
MYREDVGLVDGLTNGRAKLVYGAIGALIVAILLLVILSGGNPAEKVIADLRARLAPLEADLQTLEAKSRASGPSDSAPADPKPIQTAAADLEKQASEAIASNDPIQVAATLKRLTSQLSSVRNTLESLDRPVQGSGVVTADAKSLLGKFNSLEEEAELQFEVVIPKAPQSAEACEEFLSEVGECQARARRLASPAAAKEPDPESKAVRLVLGQIATRLQATQERLNRFAPTPPPPPPPLPPSLPFQPDQADLVVAASGILAGDLAAPLVAAWAESEIVPGEGGTYFLPAKDGRKILVKSTPVSEGFKMLAEGTCSVFFADRAPDPADLDNFSGDFRESRSVAEVVALDALTLLVHPDNPESKIMVGSTIPFQIAAGPENSSIRARARLFDLPIAGAIEESGEQAALSDRNLISLGLYHQESDNLRAKRLAVQASEETLALKPSPFTIATEDYLFSYRIVAWTSPAAAAEALQLVKFATSNEGQDVVSKRGFVDLRLTGSQEEIAPEILAALGEAIGSETVSSAVRLSTNFRFEVGQASLDLKAQADLERLPRFVFEKYPTHKVVILGFTDSDGGPQVNMPLSKDRAETVAAELRRSKVDARSAGLGPVFPVDSNTTATGKAKNRRAEVWIVRS